ncbi:MAG TPA: hypothetical protein VMM93_04785, partial [Vicinamibacterales bacterium]|nr:hypothetical protein [Vicinamibacterales bacterium]
VQNNVVTYPVWINVRNPELKLRPSLTANLDIIISRVTDVVRVPNTALRFRPTNDMYAALGLTPPTPGQGRAGAAGRQSGNGSDDPQNGRRGQAPDAAQPAPGGAAGPATAGRTGRQGFGDGTTLTPEQAREFAERFGARGGRRGGGAGGRGANQRPANVGAPVDLGQGRIDQYFTPVAAPRSRATVWTWDPTTRALSQANITVGVTDGQMSELIAGNLEVGQELITGIILPASMTSRGSTQTNPFQQQQGGRGMPGQGGGGRGGR